MSKQNQELDKFIGGQYKHGFVTDIQSDTIPPGLDESVVRLVSKKKKEPEFMLDWRLQAFAHWQTMETPVWAHVHYPPIDFQEISYFSAPKKPDDAPRSQDEVDQKLLETYDKLGIP